MDATNPARPPAVAPAKAKPDPRPMRLVLGAGGLAAFSALITAIVAPPRPVVLTADIAPQAVTDPGATTAQVQRPVQYIQLAPGQTAPPGATVIDATAPQPVTVVTKVAAPKQKPIVIRTTQSGKVIK